MHVLLALNQAIFDACASQGRLLVIPLPDLAVTLAEAEPLQILISNYQVG